MIQLRFSAYCKVNQHGLPAGSVLPFLNLLRAALMIRLRNALTNGKSSSTSVRLYPFPLPLFPCFFPLPRIMAA